MLKKEGLDGILISVNPFFLENVPFERTARAEAVSRELFGSNAIVYQTEFFRRFHEMEIRGILPFEEYMHRESKETISQKFGI